MGGSWPRWGPQSAAGILLLAALSASPAEGNPEELLRAGLLALERGNLAEARRQLEAASKLAPGQPRIWLGLAQVYLRDGSSKSAEAAAQRAAALAGNDPVCLRGLSLFFAQTGRLEPAAEFEARYAQSSGDLEAAARASLWMLRSGRPDRAVTVAEEALTRGEHAALRNALGKAYGVLGDAGRALAEYQEAIRLNPYEETYYFDLAQLLMAHHNFDVAIEVLERSKRIFAASPQLELALGVAYYGQRRFSDAVSSLLRTIELAPEVPQPYRFLARMLEHAGDRLAEVEARFAAWARRQPDNAEALRLHAKVLMASLPPHGWPVEAERSFSLLRRSVELDERQWETHYLLGLLFERKGELAAAARELERAVELSPEQPTPRFPLARVYLALGRKQEAQRERRQFRELTIKQEKAIEQRAAGMRKLELLVR